MSKKRVYRHSLFGHNMRTACVCVWELAIILDAREIQSHEKYTEDGCINTGIRFFFLWSWHRMNSFFCGHRALPKLSVGGMKNAMANIFSVVVVGFGKKKMAVYTIATQRKKKTSFNETLTAKCQRYGQAQCSSPVRILNAKCTTCCSETQRNAIKLWIKINYPNWIIIVPLKTKSHWHANILEIIKYSTPSKPLLHSLALMHTHKHTPSLSLAHSLALKDIRNSGDLLTKFDVIYRSATMLDRILLADLVSVNEFCLKIHTIMSTWN